VRVAVHDLQLKGHDDPSWLYGERVVKRPEWLRANQVVDICSVSNCNSKDFAD
jgi:hypothetical protein